MGFFGIQIRFISLSILLTLPTSSSIAKPGCSSLCGNVSIPFPFGTTDECSQSYDFLLTCNQTFNPPILFFNDSNIEITEISLDGQLKTLQYIAEDCYDQNGTRISKTDPSIELFPFTVNHTANKFTIVGCDSYGYASGQRLSDRNYTTGCAATCNAIEDIESGSCMGIGCCQMSIPENVWAVKIDVSSYKNYSDVTGTNRCSYAFVAEEGAFNFSAENHASLHDVTSLPIVVDWSIGNGTCEKGKMNISAYACKSVNSSCYKPDNGDGYRCSCNEGYRGNPYLIDGCQDIDECQDPRLHNCEKTCKNTSGGFYCICPKGYYGDGRRGGRGCIRHESVILKLVAGVSLGIIALLVPVCLHKRLKKRRLTKTRQKFFLQNGGLLLNEKLASLDGSSSLNAKKFCASELEKATNNFDRDKIIGFGGFSIVYKGVLSDELVVAVKKSRKVVDPQHIEQFINEVIVLAQINHRNVVKLLGCCLETQSPLLVYEFVNNGTLHEHVHDEAKACFLSWEVRLRIAAETAGVLSYLHSAASNPIIHRDVKSSNILLDQNNTAKVSDFGASRLVPLDQTHLTTLVQGTFGYLDPEFMQSNQLTEKSDVYSFGVVLVELLTGRKAVRSVGPEKEKSLVYFFLDVMEQDRLFEVVERSVLREENKEQLMEVAILAKSCLSIKGDERPSMKEVAMVLEGLRSIEASSVVVSVTP